MDKIDYVMRYFELHAGQRMSTFNFFIVLSALLVSALVKTFEADFRYPFAGIFISAAIIVVSGIFWKLDQRVRFLIKHSEAVLRELELEHGFPMLFSGENEKTNSEISLRGSGFLRVHMKYSQCFNFIYLLFFVIGFLCFSVQVVVSV